jgi:hypothetical protein
MRKIFGFMIGRDYHPHPTNEELQAIISGPEATD